MADYNGMKVPELKKLLNERGLTQAGNKADLIARLVENDKEQAKASEPSAGTSSISATSTFFHPLCLCATSLCELFSSTANHLHIRSLVARFACFHKCFTLLSCAQLLPHTPQHFTCSTQSSP
jgi:hypothetical protein